jgi:hypothetical protein
MSWEPTSAPAWTVPILKLAGQEGLFRSSLLA